MTEIFDLLESLYSGDISHEEYKDYYSHNIENHKSDLTCTVQDVDVFIQRFTGIHNRQDYSDILFQDNYSFSFEVLNLLQVMLDILNKDIYFEDNPIRLRVYIFQMLYYIDALNQINLLFIWQIPPMIAEIFYKTPEDMYTVLNTLSDKGISQMYWQFVKTLQKSITKYTTQVIIKTFNIVVKTVNKLYIDRS